MQADLEFLHKAQKTFPLRPQWKPRGDGWLYLISPLDIDGVTIEGLNFRATAKADRPNESVTFQLEYFPPRKGLKGGPMARIEWLPLRPHNNKFIGPVHLRGVFQKGTHHHEFDLNWEHSKTCVKKGDLPLAVPIEPEPTFEEALEFVGKAFRISPVEWISRPSWPSWQSDMF